MRKTRVGNLANDNIHLFNKLIYEPFVTTYLERFKPPKVIGIPVITSDSTPPLLARTLHSPSDGRSLAFARQDSHSTSHSWLEFFFSPDFVFIDLVKLRTNPINTPYRSFQGSGVPPQMPV